MWLHAIGLALAVMMGGCAIRTPAHSGIDCAMGAPMAEDDWPLRHADFELHKGNRDALAGFLEPLGPAGRGFLYRDVDAARAARIGEMLMFVSATNRGSPFGGPRITLGGPVNAHEIELGPGQLATFINIRRASEHAAGKGVAVYLTSVAGFSRPERALMRRLREAGWDVLTVVPSTAIIGQLRSVHIVNADDVEQGANSLARRLDSVLAEAAYAVEAALAYFEKNHGRGGQERKVLIGSSFGAMSAPAVAALLPGEFDAAVLIGGGANLLSVLDQGSMGQRRFSVQAMTVLERSERQFEVVTHDIDRAVLEALYERAIAASQLDPWHAARFFADMPVLQLHARFDRVVPTRSGDALHERLGRPERWTYPTGHFGLFFLLNFEAARVVRWIDEAIERR